MQVYRSQEWLKVSSRCHKPFAVCHCNAVLFDDMQINEKDPNLVAGEIVLRPAALLGAALSCLRNTGLYMAARLGTTCKEVMNDHSIERMAQVCIFVPSHQCQA